MIRQTCAERPNWQAKALEYGFHFHTMYGEPYWDESAFYQFTLQQIEQDIEDPTAELHQMCLAVVDAVVHDEQYLRQFCIPESMWDLVRDSWIHKAPSLYSRMDLAYNGKGPAKLLENNADTPTSLYETGFWQWLWLEEQVQSGILPPHTDQFNSLQEKLVHRFANLREYYQMSQMHFACCKDTIEDRGTVQYLQDCAAEAGLRDFFVFIEDMGVSPEGFYTDKLDRVISHCFKLYPWENIFADPFAEHLYSSQVHWLEPAYKAIISNKALLPMLWKLFPNHPNLLPAYFADEANNIDTGKWVKKPIFSREGANIIIINDGQTTYSSDGPYGNEGYIYQAFTELPKFEQHYTLIGSWLVDDLPAGISIREDANMITQDMSRFIPHVIV
jgi:glutathionylspermidine synthase